MQQQFTSVIGVLRLLTKTLFFLTFYLINEAIMAEAARMMVCHEVVNPAPTKDSMTQSAQPSVRRFTAGVHENDRK